MTPNENTQAEREDILQDLHNELYRAQTTDNPVVLLEAVGRARLLLSRYRAALSAPPAAECDHEWVSARNKYVTSGEICAKLCGAIRAEQPAADTSTVDAIVAAREPFLPPLDEDRTQALHEGNYERDYRKALKEGERWAEHIPEIRGGYSAESIIALLGNMVYDSRQVAAVAQPVAVLPAWWTRFLHELTLQNEDEVRADLFGVLEVCALDAIAALAASHSSERQDVGGGK